VLTIHPDRTDPEAAVFARAFMNGERPRYVLGRNEYAAGIAGLVDLDGFIDDYTDETEFLGKPIVRMADAPQNSLVVSAVLFVQPQTAIARLGERGLSCLDYFSFVKHTGDVFKEVDYVRAAREDIAQNRAKYEWLSTVLADAESREILEDLVNFRCTGDLRHLTRFAQIRAEQYFEPFMTFHEGDVFVDVGGYDGETTLEFIDRCPDYGSVHVFEPDPANWESLRRNLAGLRDVNIYSLGLADGDGTVRFRSGAGSASGASDQGDIEVQVRALDDLIESRVSVVKMDVEGVEAAVLDGARHHVQVDHPTLAVCCYHHVDDLWRLPERVLSFREDYAVYLRHYTEGLHETVASFVPV
jgi:FkbM family methyltransferase